MLSATHLLPSHCSINSIYTPLAYIDAPGQTTGTNDNLLLLHHPARLPLVEQAQLIHPSPLDADVDELQRCRGRCGGPWG